MKPRFATALKFIVSAGCLAAIWVWIEPAELVARIRSASLPPLIAAAIVNLFLQGSNAVKLRALFPAPRPPLRGLTEVNFVAVFFGTFIPGGMGGEVARWAYLSKECGSAGRALAAVLLDRLTGLWAQILLSLAAWMWIGRGGMGVWTALGVSAAILALSAWAGAWGYRWFTRVVSRLGSWYAKRSGNAAAAPGEIGEALSELLAKRSRFAKVLGLSVVNHGLVILVFMLVDRTAGGSISWAHASLFLFCYTFVLLLPVTLGNWGLSEGILGMLYRFSGSQSETGVLISLLIRLMAAPAVAIGWWIFLSRRGRRATP